MVMVMVIMMVNVCLIGISVSEATKARGSEVTLFASLALKVR